MKRLILAAALVAALSLAACPAHGQDRHVLVRAYVADRTETFAARAGFQSTIAFAEGERIENVAIGESGLWQVTPNRRADLLFVKPMAATAPVTNMTVVTDRRTYLFELRLDRRAAPVYLLRFTYPAEPAGSPPPPAAAALARQVEVATGAAAALANPERLNFAWSAKGARALLPDRVFDDGQAVYIAWAEGRALPAVLVAAPDGRSEGPVNFTAQGSYLVVEGCPRRLVLRSGRDSAVLETAGAGSAPNQPTVNPRGEAGRG